MNSTPPQALLQIPSLSPLPSSAPTSSGAYARNSGIIQHEGNCSATMDTDENEQQGNTRDIDPIMTAVLCCKDQAITLHI